MLCSVSLIILTSSHVESQLCTHSLGEVRLGWGESQVNRVTSDCHELARTESIEASLM